MTVELEHLLAGRVNIIRQEDAHSPRLGITATREEVCPCIVQLPESAQRDYESSERSSVRAPEIRRIALEGGPHVFAGRRKEAGVVDKAIKECGNCCQRPGILVVVMR